MNFILNHPVLSLLIALFASITLFVVIAVFFGVWKEELRAKVKKQNRKIIGLLADLTAMEETRERQAVLNLHQSIENAMLEDQLKEAKFNPKIMPYVEDMSKDYHLLIQEKEVLRESLKCKSKECESLKSAFSDASNELNAIQSAERDNEDLRAMYMDCLKENKELKERVRLNELRIKKQKLTPKTDLLDSKLWQCESATHEAFIKGNVYVKKDIPNWDFCLIGEDGFTYVCDKKCFSPVKKPAKHVI